MKHFQKGLIVREGGPKGPLSKVVNFKNGLYEVVSLDGNAVGFMEAGYLYPEPSYYQLDLFEASDL